MSIFSKPNMRQRTAVRAMTSQQRRTTPAIAISSNWLMRRAWPKLLLVSIGLAAWLVLPSAAATGIQTINFQGKLTNPDGTNVADGDYSVTFTIYDGGSSSGGGTADWSETQAVAVAGGIFQVQLGSVNPTLATAIDFNDAPLYLGTQVGSDPEMTPRILFTATPYTFNADEVGGLAAANLAQLAQGTQTDSSTTNASLAINKTAGTADILDLQRGGTSVFTINNTGAAVFSNQTDSGAGFVVQDHGANSLLTADTANDQLIVGSATADTTQTLLQLDSESNFSDTSPCTVITNQGALYYNASTGTMRGCLNGNWEDLTSTGGLGLIAFGVSPSSSNAGNPGELAGINPSTSPCKVFWDSTTSVAVAPCRAYTGGRKVTVDATTISVSGMTKNRYANICLSGPGGAPELEDTTGTATDQATVKPSWSTNNPVLCIATVESGTTNGRIGKIYDTRTFTVTQKTFATSNKALGLGWVVVQAGQNLVGTTTTAGTGNVRGVVVGYSGSTSSTTANVILATAGPQWVKATGTSTVKQNVETSTTAGYTSSVTNAKTATSYYALLGAATLTIDTSCSSADNCQYSQFLNPLSIR